MEALYLFFAVIAFRLLYLTLKKIITRNLYKWILFPMVLLITLRLIVNLDSLMVGIGGIIGVITIVIFHLMQLTKTNRWFLRELEIESAEVTRYIKLIFAFSPEVEKEFVSTRKKPFWFYRKSGRIFATRNSENGLLELLLKAFLRNRGHVTTYLQLTMMTSSAIMVLPIWLKWIIYLLFLFFFHIWLMSIYEKMQKSPFFTVVPFEKDLSHSVWTRFKKRLYLPSTVFVGLVAVVASFIDIVISLVFLKITY
jgi:ABC-2 type transport system permease protein